MRRAHVESLMAALMVLAPMPQAICGQAVPRGMIGIVERRIGPTTADLTFVGRMILLKDGAVLVTQPQDQVFKVFRHDLRQKVVGRQGEGPGEFRNLAAIGVLSDTVWISDPDLRRVTVLRPDFRLARTVAVPSTLVGPKGRLPPPRLRAIFPIGMRADGSWIVMGALAVVGEQPSWVPAEHRGDVAFLRTSSSWEFLEVMGWAPRNPCGIEVPIAGGHLVARVPFCGAPDWAIASDASRIVMVQPISDSRQGNCRLTIYPLGGSRPVEHILNLPAVTIPSRSVDSSFRSRIAQARLPAEADAYRNMKRPTHLPACTRVLSGEDGTIWVQAVDAMSSRRWVVLDRAGNPVAVIQVPSTVTLWTVSLRPGAFTGIESDGDGLSGVVWLRLAPSN